MSSIRPSNGRKLPEPTRNSYPTHLGRPVRVRNPCVFVVGCPRSGTTLVQRMLDSHPQLAVANDTHFIPVAIKGLAPCADPPLTPAITRLVQSYRTRGGMGFERMALPEDAVPAAAATATSYSEFVSALYSRLAEQRGKPWAGEKTPDYVRCLPLLTTLFPWTRVVHVIRDGRDVTLSLVDWARQKRRRGPARTRLWELNPIAASALWWNWQVSSGLHDAAAVGSAYSEVRYEALVADPEQTLRELCDFLELPYDPAMLNYHAEREKRPDDPAVGSSAQLPPTQGLRDWRTQMSVHDAELVEALTGELLSDLGYERVFPKISRPARDEAKVCRKRWARKIARRTTRDLAGRRVV